MNRLVRGSVLLAVVAFVGACGGLDTDGSDQTDHLVSDPAIVFVSNLDSQAVFVEAVNDIGQQLEGDFAISNVGAGLTAFIDTTYQPVTGREGNPTRIRLFVKASSQASLVSSSITVTANGVSLDIPVAITPANLLGTFSSLTPNVGDTISFTAGAPLTFTAASTIAFANGGAGIVTGVSVDGSTLFFLAPPGGSGAATIDDVHLPYLSTGLELTEAAGTLTVQNATSLTGTDDPATAPAFPAPAQGETVSWFDLGDFTGPDITGDGGVSAKYYQMTLPQTDTLDIILEFGTTGDLDLVICGDVACNTGSFAGATGSHPEHVTIALAAGTYWFAIVNFDGGTYASFRMDVANP